MTVHDKINRIKHFMEEEIKQQIAQIEKTSTEQAQMISQQLQITETKKVEAEIQKASKHEKQELQVKQSGILNKVRMNVLQVRDDIIHETLDKCKEKMTNVPNYGDLLGKLAVQGAEVLGVKDIIVQFCDGDEGQFSSVQDACKSSGITVKKHDNTIDKQTFIGGLNVFSSDGKIYIENTFKKRLQLAYKQQAPKLSAILFEDKSTLW